MQLSMNLRPKIKWHFHENDHKHSPKVLGLTVGLIWGSLLSTYCCWTGPLKSGETRTNGTVMQGRVLHLLRITRNATNKKILLK